MFDRIFDIYRPGLVQLGGKSQREYVSKTSGGWNSHYVEFVQIRRSKILDNVLNIGKGLVGKALCSKEGEKHKIRKQEMLNLGTKSPQ